VQDIRRPLDHRLRTLARPRRPPLACRITRSSTRRPQLRRLASDPGRGDLLARTTSEESVATPYRHPYTVAASVLNPVGCVLIR
jgi:hypothetical protein